MHRRALLGGLGTLSAVGLTGCLGVRSPVEGDETTPASRVSVNSRDTVSDQYPFDIDVEVIRSTFGEGAPATIRITTTNDGEPVKLSIGTGYCSLFDRSQGGSDNPSGLWLHRPESAANIDRKEDRWVADKPPDEPRGSANVGCTKQRYGEGQSVSSAYQVWDDYRTEGYLVPDTYRWETEVLISDVSSETDTDERSISWGFSLTLEA